MQNKKSCSKAVIDLTFGDSGKGMFVGYLCKNNHNMVIRFSGGPQAAHRVVSMKDNKEHVFSHFGSGTLFGSPTYWSKYCLVEPNKLVKEFKELINNYAITPHIFIHRDCPIITCYDIYDNQNDNKNIQHGTCGYGIYKTIKRNKDLYQLKFSDIFHPTIFNIKLQQIQSYYNGIGKVFEEFTCNAVEFLRENNQFITMVENDTFLKSCDHSLVFEGSQGLLLDQNFGFFPHVTPANIGTKNIIEMGYEPEIYLITRAYQTRHGFGPMTNAEITADNYINLHPGEKNVFSKFQGFLKKSILDINLLLYAIESDDYIRNHLNKCTLVITCLDHIVDEFQYTYNNKLYKYKSPELFANNIANILQIKNIMLSYDEYSENVILFNNMR